MAFTIGGPTSLTISLLLDAISSRAARPKEGKQDKFRPEAVKAGSIRTPILQQLF